MTELTIWSLQTRRLSYMSEEVGLNRHKHQRQTKQERLIRQPTGSISILRNHGQSLDCRFIAIQTTEKSEHKDDTAQCSANPAAQAHQRKGEPPSDERGNVTGARDAFPSATHPGTHPTRLGL